MHSNNNAVRSITARSPPAFGIGVACAGSISAVHADGASAVPVYLEDGEGSAATQRFDYVYADPDGRRLLMWRGPGRRRTSVFSLWTRWSRSETSR